MCGGCAGAPHDPVLAKVSGPRRRAAIAAAAQRRLPGSRIRAVDRAWTVADRTGKVTVCRTFAALVDALDARGVPSDVAAELLAAAAAT